MWNTIIFIITMLSIMSIATNLKNLVDELKKFNEIYQLKEINILRNISHTLQKIVEKLK